MHAIDYILILFTDSSETDFARPLPEKTNARLGKEVVLECEKYHAIWFKNKQKVQDDKNILIKHSNGNHTFTILDMKRTDIGKYSCIYGSSETTWELEIEDTDNSEKLDGKTYAQLGKEFVLKLELGKKYTAIWLKNKQNLKDDKNIVIKQFNGNHTLTVQNMKTSDMGKYSCICGSAETTSELKIEEADCMTRLLRKNEGTYTSSGSAKHAEMTFELTTEESPLPQQVYAKLGQKVVLECKFKKRNPAKWFKNKQNVTDDTNISINTLNGNHTLAISHMTKKDLGMYICSEQADHAEQKTFELTIKDIRVPVALLVINGDLDTLDHVMRAIYNDMSVVVMKGTGGAADLIALCLEE
ncbi:OBSCN [Mytilus coruscus]|uniref:OBSCN n=1 Tax=Mytilus coruscus TaxID=42192 RepID=A0A6J8A9T9_MYTCO|nr:OBSCN [Mytilus coruscus]